MKTLDRGYLQLKTPEVTKWLHFSRTSITQLLKLSGDDFDAFQKRISKPNQTPEEEFDIMALLAHSALIAYDLEEGNEIDYNEHKVANWVYEAAQEEENFGLKLVEAFMLSLPLTKKSKGQVKEMVASVLKT